MCFFFQLLEEICVLGKDPKYTCSRTPSKAKIQEPGGSAPAGNVDADNDTSSDDEEDEDEIASTMSQTSTLKSEAEIQQ